MALQSTAAVWHYVWSKKEGFVLESTGEGRSRFADTNVDRRQLPPVLLTVPDLSILFRGLDSIEQLREDWEFMLNWANPVKGFVIRLSVAPVQHAVGPTVQVFARGYAIDESTEDSAYITVVRNPAFTQDEHLWVPFVYTTGNDELSFGLDDFATVFHQHPSSKFLPPAPAFGREVARAMHSVVPGVIQADIRDLLDHDDKEQRAGRVGTRLSMNSPHQTVPDTLVYAMRDIILHEWFRRAPSGGRGRRGVPWPTFWFACFVASCWKDAPGKDSVDRAWDVYRSSQVSWARPPSRPPPPEWSWRKMFTDATVVFAPPRLIALREAQDLTSSLLQLPPGNTAERFAAVARHSL